MLFPGTLFSRQVFVCLNFKSFISSHGLKPLELPFFKKKKKKKKTEKRENDFV